MPKIEAFGEACDEGDLRCNMRAAKHNMSDEFVHTGQSLTGNGAAYCPIERKRRGPGALAAALSILVLGAGFLAISATSAPQKTSEAPISIALQPETEARESVADARNIDIASAIEQSRSARLDASASNAETISRDSDTFAPSLKPSRTEGAPKDSASQENKSGTEHALAPRLKPAASETVIAETNPVTQPMKLGGLFLASDDDAPPPVFFTSDIERRVITHANPQIQLVKDIVSEPENVRVRLSRGENFVDALKRAGVSAEDANTAAYAFGRHHNLRRLLPGQEFALTLGWPNQTLFQQVTQAQQARLIRLEYRADVENRVIVRRELNGDMTAEKKTIPLTTRVMSVAGRINGSLYMSAKAVGAPDEVIANLADAFAYDVDFQREIFGGDEFEAIFEVKYDDLGKLVSSGDILYARLNWRGRSREKGYYRFDDESGDRVEFYDATGQGAKRLLMKTPIDGARLSSGFGTRKHPILGYRRAHKGVDFAANRGTPIKAAGDGIVERANRYGSFGNYIRIRHANGYQTAYAHLNGFARGIRSGKRVRQGDIIGYVGTTGRSTGPHLHYEVHLNGKAVNPQRLKIATGKKLTGSELDRFRIQRDIINAMRMPEAEREALYARDESSSSNETL
ncbi:peptidoglycan DD-metalloendopeptidase family protein [Hyphococcus flavus]|uniref:Peptidoglycan DD-metalloendopeptidase family protein n=1 Tax=Hyphococcus flavus TaxID=1866326 RepID=A0AAE9ZIR9_9PROT|nr:peptidoglycan DD-metalloendopeptidase family protein [Hyphococcus flavus]WDI31776.1 peptidoglycan DD-metalloendopeptidase family protein [Hyphococcus flavus]